MYIGKSVKRQLTVVHGRGNKVLKLGNSKVDNVRGKLGVYREIIYRFLIV